MLLVDWLELEKNLGDMEVVLKSYFKWDFEEMWYLGYVIYIIVLKEFLFVDICYYWKLDFNGDFVFIIRGLKFNCVKF